MEPGYYWILRRDDPSGIPIIGLYTPVYEHGSKKQKNSQPWETQPWEIVASDESFANNEVVVIGIVEPYSLSTKLYKV